MCRVRPYDAKLFGCRSNVGNGNVPVGEKNFEAALFFALVGRLVGKKFLHGFFFGGIRSCSDGGILEGDGDAIVPAGLFRHVVGRRFDFDGEEVAGFDALLQQRVVVLQEEIQKFLLMSPLNFVVVLHGVGFVRAALRGSALSENKWREKCAECGSEKKFHASLRRCEGF